MTFEEALHIPKDAEFQEKYRMIIQTLGFEDVRSCIPFSDEKIRDAFKTDRNLNNLPIAIWDRAAGFEQSFQGKCIYIGSRLSRLIHEKTQVTYSEGVCILKECAVMITEGCKQAKEE